MKKLSGKKKYIIAIILILIFAACFIPAKPEIYNSKYKLNIVGPYGDNEAYHPKVLSFKEKWNGYRYWMSYTPYPKSDDSKENPCIAVSNDLINWKEPKGFKNPLDTPNDVRPQLRYNSDSHIVYNNVLNRMECYWRYVDDVKDEAILFRRCTYDGINWSEREVAAIAKNRKSDRNDYVSPAILFEDNMYKMWYIKNKNRIIYATSKDGLHWQDSKEIKLSYEENVKTWHLDIIHTEKGYEMITVAYKNWKQHNGMNLYYASSQDGVEWNTAKVILKPTVDTKCWDNKGIYRSSFIYEDGIYYLFYGGTSENLNHGIGLMYGKDILKLNNVKTNYKVEKEVNELKKQIQSIKNEKI